MLKLKRMSDVDDVDDAAGDDVDGHDGFSDDLGDDFGGPGDVGGYDDDLSANARWDGGSDAEGGFISDVMRHALDGVRGGFEPDLRAILERAGVEYEQELLTSRAHEEQQQRLQFHSWALDLSRQRLNAEGLARAVMALGEELDVLNWNEYSGPVVFGSPISFHIFDRATGAAGEIVVRADAGIVREANSLAVLKYGALQRQSEQLEQKQAAAAKCSRGSRKHRRGRR